MDLPHILAFTLFTAFFMTLLGAGTRTQWRIWRCRADRTRSARYEAAGLGLTGVGLVTLFAVLLLPEPPRWAVLTAFWGLCVPAAAFFLAARITQGWETEQARQRDVQLALPVPKRMIPPWGIAVLWLVGTMLITFTAGYGVLWQAWPQPWFAVQDRFQSVIYTVTALGLALGAAHTGWQTRRRRREHRRVQQELVSTLTGSPERDHPDQHA
ncbi:hypothetical protein FHX42_005204 [Saccharopolyspora lacisalsi]|uniref:Uncharacterized protein n=1 Tax=Halosaccharopolyspora lacisalsi TaxID=1000566 RepID=A0A839E7W9_9PSEU|nr:hypothetical protein [Halosaccharopolyspora lacisalsi]MBA8827797.1 hypothetical protein [Halosaccharopolyspora lacisalsi]